MSPYRFTEKTIQTEMALVTIQNLLNSNTKQNLKLIFILLKVHNNDFPPPTSIV